MSSGLSLFPVYRTVTAVHSLPARNRRRSASRFARSRGSARMPRSSADWDICPQMIADVTQMGSGSSVSVEL